MGFDDDSKIFFFLFSIKQNLWVLSLEIPQQGSSKEFHNIFLWKNKQYFRITVKAVTCLNQGGILFVKVKMK